MNQLSKYGFSYIPAIVVTIIIFVLSALSSDTIRTFNLSDLFALDKLGHFIAYFTLSFLYYYGFVRSKKRKPNRNELIWMILLCSLYGILLEFCQLYFFSSRCFEVLDMIANTLGIICGVVFGMIMIKPQ